MNTCIHHQGILLNSRRNDKKVYSKILRVWCPASSQTRQMGWISRTHGEEQGPSRCSQASRQGPCISSNFLCSLSVHCWCFGASHRLPVHWSTFQLWKPKASADIDKCSPVLGWQKERERGNGGGTHYSRDLKPRELSMMNENHWITGHRRDLENPHKE